MTTIVYRDGILAADSRGYSGDQTAIGNKMKIHRLADGTIFGISTNNVGGDSLIKNWIEDGCKHPENGDVKPDSFSILMIKKNGEVFFANDNYGFSGPLDAPFYAIGSGRKYALAALHLGKSAVEAVEVACIFDLWSGGPVNTKELQWP